jgi:hypothetical protein
MVERIRMMREMRMRKDQFIIQYSAYYVLSTAFWRNMKVFEK